MKAFKIPPVIAVNSHSFPYKLKILQSQNSIDYILNSYNLLEGKKLTVTV